MNRKILVFGLTALDIISVCEEFPIEDEDVRVLKQYWQKGGNAANTSQVLAQMGVDVELLSSFASGSPQSEFCKASLTKHCVNIEKSIHFEHAGFPTSCCIVTNTSGSRTILHCRNGFPEMGFEHFKTVNLKNYNWVHFEGRGFPYLTDMVVEAARVRDHCEGQFKISIEFEKPKRHDDLIASNIAALVDVLFLSKDFAMKLGYLSANETVLNVKKKLGLRNELVVICAWGGYGADAIDENGVIHHSDSFPPDKVVDTLGAGDTFNAGVLCALHRGSSLKESISYGCQIAGKKCGQYGFENVVQKS